MLIGCWGRGRAAYDPDMMLALLLYAYANKVHASRSIERLCGIRMWRFG